MEQQLPSEAGQILTRMGFAWWCHEPECSLYLHRQIKHIITFRAQKNIGSVTHNMWKPWWRLITTFSNFGTDHSLKCVVCLLFIKDYVHVRTWVQCQNTNPKLHKEASVLHPITVKAEVWHQIGIDLVGLYDSVNKEPEI